MKSYTIEIHRDEKFVCRRFFGDLVFDEILESWMEILNVPEFNNDNYDLISDYTEATVQVSVNSLNKVGDFYESIGQKYRGRKHAVVVAKPRQTAFSKLFKQKYDSESGILFDIFEEMEAAVNWIKNES